MKVYVIPGIIIVPGTQFFWFQLTMTSCKIVTSVYTDMLFNQLVQWNKNDEL